MKWRITITLPMIAMALLACSDPANVNQSIRKLTRGENVTAFHLNEVTRFAWDEVILFGPYVPRSQVCAKLGIPTKDCERFVTMESTDDSDMTLAFVMQGCLVAYAKHRRIDGDFLPLPPAYRIAVEDASFRVVRATAVDGGAVVRLVQQRGAPVSWRLPGS